MEAIRLALGNMAGVKDVQVNETIGSVTIYYDPRHHPDLEQHLADENCPQDAVQVEAAPKMGDLSEIEGLLEHEAAFLAEHSHFAKATVGWVESLDRAVKSVTNNTIDFKVVAPLALAVGAFLELGVEASTPVWLTMGLFSLNHLIELHTHATANSSSNRGPARPAGQA